jgi:predicted nucleic acid-binding protein
MILLDTSGLWAALDARQPQHTGAKAAIGASGGPLALSPFVLAELDYLTSTRVSTTAARALLEEVGRGAYRLESMTADDIAEAADIIDRYSDLELGLADASVVVLSRRYGVNDVLTLDERHFRAIEGSRGQPFRLLPADA